MSMLDSIIRQGFFIVYHTTEDPATAMLDDVRHYIASVDANSWRQVALCPDNSSEPRGEPRLPILHRNRHLVDASMAGMLSETFAQDWKAVHPRMVAHTWTLESGADPVAHRDFPVDLSQSHLDHLNLSAGVIIALRGMTTRLWGWNRLVPEPQEVEEFNLIKGDMLVYRGSMVYMCAEFTSMYLHAFLEKSTDASATHQARLAYMSEVPMLEPVERPPAACPLYTCTYAPKKPVNGRNLQKHLSRDHGIRRSNRQEAKKRRIRISELCS